MIFGADNQNKNLRLAADRKVDSTAKTRSSNQYAVKIASRNTAQNSGSQKHQQTTRSESRSTINDGKADPIRGSFEGLDNSKSAYIQSNGVGYANKALQNARNTLKTSNIQPGTAINGLSFTNRQNQGIINNYSNYTSVNSSSDRLSNILKMNRY